MLVLEFYISFRTYMRTERLKNKILLTLQYFTIYLDFILQSIYSVGRNYLNSLLLQGKIDLLNINFIESCIINIIFGLGWLE